MTGIFTLIRHFDKLTVPHVAVMGDMLAAIPEKKASSGGGTRSIPEGIDKKQVAFSRGNSTFSSVRRVPATEPVNQEPITDGSLKKLSGSISTLPENIDKKHSHYAQIVNQKPKHEGSLKKLSGSISTKLKELKLWKTTRNKTKITKSTINR